MEANNDIESMEMSENRRSQHERTLEANRDGAAQYSYETAGLLL